MTRRPGPVAFILFWTAVSAVARVLAFGALYQLGRPVPWDILGAAGDVLVLGVIVSWRWWWAPATIGSAAIKALVAARVGRSVYVAGPFFPILSVVGALPQWLLLRRYGWRSLAWLAVPPLTARLTAALLTPETYLLSDRVASEWIPRVALSGVAAGLVEAVVLAWILKSEFGEPAAVAPALEPASVPTASAPPQLASVRVCLIATLVLSIPIFAPQLFVQTSTPLDLSYVLFIVAIVAPWALALLLLVHPRLRHPGLVLAASASIITLVPLVPFMVLATLLSGFMLGNKDQWLSYACMMTAIALLTIIVIQATGGAFKIPRSARSTWAWPAAIAGCIAYALILAASVSALDRRTERQAAVRQGNDALARQNVVILTSCAAAYAQQYPDRGFPASANELTTGNPPCLDAAVAAGEASGYRYRYLPAMPDASGAVRGYNLCAEPIEYLKTGSDTMVADQTGRLPLLESPGQDIRVGISCRDAWSRDYVKAIRYCAADYAATHRDRGYPSTLREIGLDGNRCLVTTWDEYKYEENSHYTGEEVFTYVAGLPDSAGRVLTYEIHGHRGTGNDSLNEVADHLGEVRQVKAQRLATSRDPLGSVLVERRRKWTDVATVEPLCARGEADACRALALLVVKNDPGNASGARAAYERGCELSDGESCLALARLISGRDSPAPDTAALVERACANHSGEACMWLVRELGNAPVVSQLEQYLDVACDAGTPNACIRLGERLAGSDPSRSRRLIVKGCAALDDEDRCIKYR